MRISDEGSMNLSGTLLLIKLVILAIIYSKPSKNGCSENSILNNEIFTNTSEYGIGYCIGELQRYDFIKLVGSSRFQITSGGRSFLLNNANRFKLVRILVSNVLEKRRKIK